MSLKYSLLFFISFLIFINKIFASELDDPVYCRIDVNNVPTATFIGSLTDIKSNRTCTHIEGIIDHELRGSLTNDLVNKLFQKLDKIQVVSGYVVFSVSHNQYPREITMRSLRTIKGERLKDGYSLLISRTSGILREISFPRLTLILNGKVGFFATQALCKREIYWPEILVDPTKQIGDDHREAYQTKCDKISCHSNCVKLANTTKSFCYGPNADQCQPATRCKERKACSRCFDFQGSEECCNEQCAGGCNGPTARDCFSCANKLFNGTCVAFCPPNTVHRTGLCLAECPMGYLNLDNECVESCGIGFLVENRKCEKCHDKCPKSCKIPDENGVSQYLEKKHLPSLEGCTHLYGSLMISYVSFKTITNVSDLLVLSNLVWIEGSLYLNFPNSPNIVNDPRMESLFFLKNLKVVAGARGGGKVRIGYIASMPSLKYLGLTSLQSIQAYGLAFVDVPNLVYGTTVNWKKLGLSLVQIWNMPEKQGPCDPECDTEMGCWGPGPLQCVKCAHYRLPDINSCVANCGESGNYYNSLTANSSDCKMCHVECDGGCHGAGPFQCKKCKHFKISETGECVSKGNILVLETESKVKEILAIGSECPTGYTMKIVTKNILTNLAEEIKKFLNTGIVILCSHNR